MRDWGCVLLCLLVGAGWGFLAWSLEATSLAEALGRTAIGGAIGALFGAFCGRWLLERITEWLP